MITEYLAAALRHARYEILPDDGGILGHIPDLPGVWANEATLEATREDLRVTLESWIALALARGVPIPPIAGVELAAPELATS